MNSHHFINRLRRAKPALACRTPHQKPTHTRHIYSPTIPVRSFSADRRFLLEPIAGFPVDLSSPYCLDAIERYLAAYAQANPETTDAVLMICRHDNFVNCSFGDFLTPANASQEAVCFSPEV
jgi:hypothetical protein